MLCQLLGPVWDCRLHCGRFGPQIGWVQRRRHGLRGLLGPFVCDRGAPVRQPGEDPQLHRLRPANACDPSVRAEYNGVYFSNQVLFDKSIPAIGQMYANMEKYIPHFNPNTIPDFGLFGGYLTADLMIRGLEAAGRIRPGRRLSVTFAK